MSHWWFASWSRIPEVLTCVELAYYSLFVFIVEAHKALRGVRLTCNKDMSRKIRQHKEVNLGDLWGLQFAPVNGVLLLLAALWMIALIGL